MKRFSFLLFILTALVLRGQAQFSGTNLSEYQWGKLGDTNEKEFNSIYNRLMLNYGYKAFKFTLGGQAYYTPYEDRNYFDPAWVSASYKKGPWSVKLGNFNETIGRGLLLRSYEIPGALLEDKGYRSKNYFYRDILGASAGYKSKYFDLKAIWGYTRNNIIPPTFEWEKQRSDEIAAFSGSFNIGKQKIGGSFMRTINDASENYFTLFNTSGQISSNFSYYLAYAFRAKTDTENTEGDYPHAIYSSFNFSAGKIGLSLELKDYRQFLIGTGINEPPALVKEHTYRTLNRSTHVLLPDNERGLQLEAFYQASLWTVISANYTMASNETFDTRHNYHEWFLELSTSLGDATDLKAFADYAVDPFNDVEARISLGLNLDQAVGKHYGIKLETEWQRFKRFDENVYNFVTALTFRYKSKFYLGVTSELSNDSFLTEEDYKLWVGGFSRYKINNKHSIQLFAGERRGGPACNAGICYEVLDFKGVELRWNARF